MFPMISGVGEIIRAKEFLTKAKAQLQERGIDFDQGIKVGCMIETPSAVTISDMLADEVDFFSVGTNDLVQYLLAVDRINNEISYLYEPHHPAVIRAIEQIARVSKEKNIEVTLCGEIAGDPHFLPLLIGLGVDALSATSTMLPELKFFGRRFTMAEVHELRSKIMEMRRPSEIKECLKSFYEERVSELII
jgi:phosphotransferase system enzyme I (PtsI)